MEINGRSAASKRVVVTGSSEPCDSETPGVDKYTVRLKLTATLPKGAVDKALMSTTPTTSTPVGPVGPVEGKPPWWGALASFIGAGIAGLISAITLTTGPAVGAWASADAATIPAGDLSLSTEEPAFQMFRPAALPIAPAITGKPLPLTKDGSYTEDQYPIDSRELLESVNEEYGGLVGKRFEDYIRFRDSGKYSDDEMYFLKDWLKEKSITLREVKIRAAIMANEPIDMVPFWDYAVAKATKALILFPVSKAAGALFPPIAVIPIKTMLAIEAGVDIVSRYNNIQSSLMSRPKLSDFVTTYDWSPEDLQSKYEEACDEAWKVQQSIDAKVSEVKKVQAAEKLDSDQLDQVEEQVWVNHANELEEKFGVNGNELRKELYINQLKEQIHGLKLQSRQLNTKTAAYKLRKTTGWGYSYF